MPDALPARDRAAMDVRKAAARDGPARVYAASGSQPDRATVARCLADGQPVPAEIIARTVFHLFPRSSV